MMFTAFSAECSGVKGPASKKPKQEKQRSRKDKASQHSFSHPLLAASLKVNWNTHFNNFWFWRHVDIKFNQRLLVACTAPLGNLYLSYDLTLTKPPYV